MTKTHFAALTFTALSALAGTGILVHQSTTGSGKDGDVTPRTVVQAEPAPCPFPYPLAICSPEPPAPVTRLEVSVPEEPMDGVADEYSAAWEEVK